MKRPKETLRLPASWVGWIAGASIFITTCFVPIETDLPGVVVWILRVVGSAIGGLVCFYLSKRVPRAEHNNHNPLVISDRLIVGPVPFNSALEQATRKIISQGKIELAGLPVQSPETLGMMDIYSELEVLADSKGSMSRKELEAEWFSKRRAFEELRAKFSGEKP